MKLENKIYLSIRYLLLYFKITKFLKFILVIVAVPSLPYITDKEIRVIKNYLLMITISNTVF